MKEVRNPRTYIQAAGSNVYHIRRPGFLKRSACGTRMRWATVSIHPPRGPKVRICRSCREAK